MDESAIDAKGIAALKPELDLINALKSKTQLAGELAHLHAITTQLEPPTDSGAETALFGFTSGQDLDDASTGRGLRWIRADLACRTAIIT